MVGYRWWCSQVFWQQFDVDLSVPAFLLVAFADKRPKDIVFKFPLHYEKTKWCNGPCLNQFFSNSVMEFPMTKQQNIPQVIKEMFLYFLQLYINPRWPYIILFHLLWLFSLPAISTKATNEHRLLYLVLFSSQLFSGRERDKDQCGSWDPTLIITCIDYSRMQWSGLASYLVKVFEALPWV